ncbi:MAG: alpha/beta hydrolase [Bacteroidota bacterium]
MKRFLFIILTAMIIGCGQNDWYREGETFYLENHGAVMPVWVTGNLSSGIFIIANHGGPGFSSGLEFHRPTYGFKELEKKYALVYWDQRMSGSAKGDPKFEDMSVDIHVEDLEKLVTLIQSRYNPGSLFLYGHSWGGGLSLEFMGKGINQLPFNGMIIEDGSIQDRYEMIVRRAWVVPRAEAKLTETGDEYWKEVLAWWENNPNPTEADLEPYEHIRELGGYVYDPEASKQINPTSEFDYLFFSPMSFFWYTANHANTDYMANYDFMPNAKNIDRPTLIVWGVEDGAVPVILSDTIFSLIATPTEDKFQVKYEACGHSPHFEKPFDFYNEVTAFIEKYK